MGDKRNVTIGITHRNNMVNDVDGEQVVALCLHTVYALVLRNTTCTKSRILTGATRRSRTGDLLITNLGTYYAPYHVNLR